MPFQSLSEREREILTHSLRRWIDVERTDGNVVAASLLDDILADVERSGPTTYVRPPAPPREKYLAADGSIRYRREAA